MIRFKNKSVHRKKFAKLLVACLIGNSLPLIMGIISFAWFYSNSRAPEQNVDGSVGLREYFYRGDGYIGDGSEQYPHEIVTPIHFYNLTRLQNLGVFPEKTYFRVGHVFEGYESEGPKCLDGDTKVDVLDMTSFCENNPVVPIGNEGTPFYGEFDGQFIPIVGLRVASNPEDIGMFGYITYTSEVRNIVCKDLEICSRGYSTVDDSNFLYSESIDNIFSSNASNFETASLSFVSEYEEENHNHQLKQLEIFSIQDLDAKASVVNDENSQFNGKRIVAGKFIPSFPTIDNHDNIEYSISSSASVIEIERGTNNLVINLDNLPDDFDNDVPIRMSSGISLVASVKVNGIKYARVIQTYNIDIVQAPIVENGENVLTLKVECSHTEGNNPINKAHGNNIGYIVGHDDGNVIHCYVYNGKMTFNPDDANLNKVSSHSEIGLVGKVGNNVSTDIDPSNVSSKGETGVLNFSYVYSLIREPFEVGDQTVAGYQHTYDSSLSNPSAGTKKAFVVYATDEVDETTGKYLPRGTEAASFELYKEYLRCDTDDPKNYVAFADQQEGIYESEIGNYGEYTIPNDDININMNAVDFADNKVICDGLEDSEYRGLGVFRIATAYNSILAQNPNLESSLWRNNLGACSIIHDTPEKAKKAIYFSTAECDWSKAPGIPGWTQNGSIEPVIMNTLPTYSNVGSFRCPFSRDFNYMFRLDLNEADDFKIGHDIYNYMYDTDNEFLQNYLSSILIDKLGAPVKYKNKGFGFKVQFSQDAEEPVKQLDSYMKIGKPTSLNRYTVNGETKYYPQKSVSFTIENPNGANVTIAGCGGYISIYSYDPDVSTAPVELYTMRSAANNSSNMGRFFPYSSSGETNTQSEVLPVGGDMKDSNFLFGHIFKLPRGNYVVGSSIKMNSGSAYLYYLCVQGQTNGDLGEMAIANTGNFIENVDFLLKDPVVNSFNPTSPSFNDTSFFAKYSFQADFNDVVGMLIVDACTIDSTTYIRTRFNDFVSYLLLYCRKNNPSFVVNSETISGQPLYNGPFENFTSWEG